MQNLTALLLIRNEIIGQEPTKGFLGFGKKSAIICAYCKNSSKSDIQESKNY